MQKLTFSNCLFCPDNSFQKQVIDLLYKHLFDKSICIKSHQTDLEDVYDEMEKELNNPNKTNTPFLYPADANVLKKGVNSNRLSSSAGIYAGHDLPAWLGDPNTADLRIMFISQDPRRNEKEMRSADICNQKGLTLSTPFGLHDIRWRSHLSKGLPLHVADKLLNGCSKEGKQLSIYFTDIYKLRGVDSQKKHSKEDSLNKDLYKTILEEEIKLFRPDLVVLMGKATHSIKNNLESQQIKPIKIPHPNAKIDVWKKCFPNIAGGKSIDKQNCIIEKIKSFLP